MRKHTKQGHHCSLEVHVALAATTPRRTARCTTPLQLCLPEVVEVTHWARLTHSTVRFLVFLYFGDLFHLLPESLQFLELAYLIGKDVRKQVDDLVDNEIQDADVIEKPRIKLTLFFV